MKKRNALLFLAVAFVIVAPAAVPAGSDFDNDGYDDIAVGVPGQSVGGDANAGEVDILLSSRNGDGVSTNRTVTLRQSINGCLGSAEEEDQFGWQLASGDFNGDGFDDLVVGTPHETVAGTPEAGVVQVFYGPINPARGCPEEENQERWTQEDVIFGERDPRARFGWALEVGDFNGDGFDDLVISAPWNLDYEMERYGSVYLALGSGEGLNTPELNVWGSGARGYALAAGDFDADGFDDLAIGLPDGEGKVQLRHGDPDVGLWGTSHFHGDDFLDQDDTAGASPEPGDHFGATLASGDFNNDGVDDLIVGVPGEDVRVSDLPGWSGGEEDAGMIHFIPGKSDVGLDTSQTRNWHQSTAGIEQTAEAGDEFGSVLAVADFNHDGYDDLAVGVPKEDRKSVEDAGIVQVILGGADGLTTNDTVIHQGVAGIRGSNDPGDAFGSALMTGHFDEDTFADLVIGVPGEDLFSDPEVDAGRIVVLYGTWLGPDVSSGQEINQATLGLTAEANEGFGAALLSGRSTDLSELE